MKPTNWADVWEVLGYLLGLFGIGNLLKDVVNWLLGRKTKREDNREAMSKAQVDDNAALRSQLIEQLNAERDRVAALSRQLGEEIQKASRAEAIAEAMKAQNEGMSKTLTSVLQQNTELEQRNRGRADEYDVLRNTFSQKEIQLDECQRETIALKARLRQYEPDISHEQHPTS